MSADPITYCLERVSDNRDFERLCSAFFAGAGYPGIDPLGRTCDEGRDAIIRCDEDRLRIFWTPETQQGVLKSLCRSTNSKDVALLAARRGLMPVS